MSEWWASLSHLERIFAYIAFPATLLLILQTLMLLFGLGHDSSDTSTDSEFDSGLDLDGDGIPDLNLDLDGDGIPDVNLDLDGDGLPDVSQDGGFTPDSHDSPFAGLKLLTLRGIIAFFAVAGWGGLWLLRMGLNPAAAVFLAVAMGFWAMLLMAVVLRVAMRLQSDGTMDYRNALGQAGTVYLTIPAMRAGTGKVNLLLQEQWMELEAVTDEPRPLVTGTEVVVVSISGGNTLVVCRK